MHTQLIDTIHADRVIIASNRGPVEYHLNANNTLECYRGLGGVVTALTDAANLMGSTWVAMAITKGDRFALSNVQCENGGLLPSPSWSQNIRLRYTSITEDAFRKHYEQICSGFLWPLQHYMYELAEEITEETLLDAWENGYCVANQAIADAVCAEVKLSDSKPVILLQDYSLYLVSSMIRQVYPSIVIQQFVHIPWPEARYWCFLPQQIAYALYSGLVGNDIVGFQTERDARNFLDGAQTIIDGSEVDFVEGTIFWQGHLTRVHAYPISISVEKERQLVYSETLNNTSDIEVVKSSLDKKIIMRVDRVDPAKNITRGFLAYDRLLGEHLELRGEVVFLAFLVPAREAVPAYKHYKAEVFQIIDSINQKHGTAEWTPIQVFYGNNRTRALSAMQYYDVLLVNPLFDGMNLIVKEGAVVNKRNGIAVLSRNAGAFAELRHTSIPISPRNIMETAQGLYQALTLSAEKRRTMALHAREIVENHTLNNWLAQQIFDINNLLEEPVRSFHHGEGVQKKM